MMAGTEFRFDVNALTLGDLEDLERECGLSFADITKIDPENLSARVLIAMVWISRRHERPDYTLEDARRERITAFSPPDPPTPAAVEAAGDVTASAAGS